MRRALPTLAFLLAACADEDRGPVTPPPDPVPSGVAAGVRLELVASGLQAPLGLVEVPGGDGRLLVVEQTGRVRVLEGGEVTATFLDLSDAVSGGNEQGLLGLALHPGFATNGRLFVNYTDRDGTTRVVEYRVSDDDPNQVDPASAQELLAIEQPYANHNGGMLLFGPDGRLYVAVGDGGSGGDPQGNAQDLDTLLGKLLRLDVETPGVAKVPADNPFGTLVWSYGLRNPWRFAFDPETGDLYIADVGQDRFEEVNVAPGAVEGGVVTPGGRGVNFGWDIYEGFRPFETGRDDGVTDPLLDYGQDSGCSVTGGFVYRGQALPALQGRYFYSDFCSAFIRSLRYDGGLEDHWDWTGPLTADLDPAPTDVSAFGLDAQGELYLLSLAGRIWRFAPP